MDHVSGLEVFDSQEVDWFFGSSTLNDLTNIDSVDGHRVESAQVPRQTNLRLSECLPQMSPRSGNVPPSQSRHTTSVSPLPFRSWTPNLTLTDSATAQDSSLEAFRTGLAFDSPSYDLAGMHDGYYSHSSRQTVFLRGNDVPRTMLNDLSLSAKSGRFHEENQYISGSAISNHHDFLQSGDGFNVPGDKGYHSDRSEVFGNLGESSQLSSHNLQPGGDDEALKESTTSSIPSSEDAEEENGMDQPYARLIHRAMMEAPGHRMTLRQIYGWFRENTTKARDAGSKGWQNSIRHNLSMNQAFESEKSSVGTGQSRKSSNVWVLTEKALRHGVQSTTRYRKAGVNKKMSKTRIPQRRRQQAGARGGRATRRAAMMKTQQKQVVQPNLSSLFPGEVVELSNDVASLVSSPLLVYENRLHASSPQQLNKETLHGTGKEEDFALFTESLPSLPLDETSPTQLTTTNEDVVTSSLIPIHNDFDDFLL